MAKKRYDEASVLKMLGRRVQIDYSNKCIGVVPNTLGNHSWGKVDYLCHYCGWHWMKVNTTKPKTENIVNTKKDNNHELPNKFNKTNKANKNKKN